MTTQRETSAREGTDVTRTDQRSVFVAFVLCAVALLAVMVAVPAAQTRDATYKVEVAKDAAGMTLQVDGKPMMVFGMNWDYFPIGTNYNYSLWTQPDDIIEAALTRDMPLLKAMGVNVIRQYVGIPARWVKYIYEKYGIYTALNHPMGRYGFTLDGIWIPHVNYADPKLRAGVKAEIIHMVEEFKDTPGVLMWMLGNENNYGLAWTSFEAEALPVDERDTARAHYLYSLFSEITDAIKATDKNHPVAIVNGDVQYVDVIAQECKNIDIFGTNVYRGISARDLFQVVKSKLDLPVMFAEFGADAFNAKDMQEDQVTQARYLLGQWEEIYEMSSGKGRVGNAIGGIIFQWVDGWWKFGQESRLDIHDTNASWPNAGYAEDYVEGDNNMNEEWWGITAKGPTDHLGLYEVYPRAAYYALMDAFRLDPYAPGTDLATIRRHFRQVQPAAAALEARGDQARRMTDIVSKVRVTGVRIEFETYSTGGERITTPKDSAPQDALPSFLGFDRLESYYVDLEAKPAENITGVLSLNILGNVPENPIDEIFYEKRGRPVTVGVGGQEVRLNGLERVKVYNAGLTWDDRWFTLDAFYRLGHTHWGYEGDFFGIYHDAFYGENLDIYNGDAPNGAELTGKKLFKGGKLAFGPQLWWGANPAILLKYRRQINRFDWTAIYHEDIANQNSINSSIAVPIPKTRRASLQVKTNVGDFGIEAGGLWAGQTRVGQPFQIAELNSNGTYRILQDKVKNSDLWSAKGKVTYQKGRWNWYGQAGYFGIVSWGGPTSVITFTDWQLKDPGLGNGTNFMSGVAVNFGNWQIAPNFMYQKPLVGPVPATAPPPGRPRNILDDPFSVRDNREMSGVEFVITHDPTPATWMWAWDNIAREDARLAWALGYTYRDYLTTMDAAIGILEDGVTTFAFPAATPPRALWEVRLRTASRVRSDLRIITNWYGGTGEPRGDDPRLVRRFGGYTRIAWRESVLEMSAKFNDWGPYDYHRDFNLTFPAQLMADLSFTLGLPRWFGDPQTRFGIRGTWRSLDANSNRYCPGMRPDASGNLVCDPTAPGDNGYEYEIRTYVHFAL